MFSKATYTETGMAYVKALLTAKDQDLQVHSMASAAVMVMIMIYGAEYARKYFESLITTMPEIV